MSAITPEPILNIATGFMAAKQLFAASEIGLFEALADGPASLEELSGKTAVPARTIGIVVAAMVSLGLIDHKDSLYRNGEPAATFLAGKPGHDVRPVLRFFNSISYPVWERFADAVRGGEGQAQFGKFDREQQQIFSAGVEAFTAPVAASLAVAYSRYLVNTILGCGNCQCSCRTQRPLAAASGRRSALTRSTVDVNAVRFGREAAW